MKIAHFLGTFDRTGVTTVVKQLATTMADSGHEVDIIIWDGEAPSTLANNVNIVRINIFGLSRRPLLGKYFRKAHKYLLSDVIYHYLYASIFSRYLEFKIEDKEYKQVFFHGMRYYPFYKITIPHVVVAHSVKSLSLLNSKSNTKNKIIKYCLKSIYHNKTILTVSNGVREDLINNFSADKNKTFCVYNPFNLENIRKKSDESIPNYHFLDNYILSIGRDSNQKRFDVLLDAYALSGIVENLVILGSKEKHFKNLKLLAKKLNIAHKVYFIDHQENPFPYIKHAKLVVVTSEFEGFGNTIVESLICGVPVVSTDCIAGPREILEGNLSKYLAKTNDPIDIAEKIKTCINDLPEIDVENLKRFEDRCIAKKYLQYSAYN